MVTGRAVTALLVVQWLALSLCAQQSGEYGRASSEEIVMTTKSPARLSGSLEVSQSTGGDLLGRDSNAYGLTAGGTLLRDRLWFFASGSKQTASPARWSSLQLPENAASDAIGARVNGQLTASQNFSAYFAAARRPELVTSPSSTFAAVVPSTFLSLRYTGVVSPNMFFTASVTSSTRSVEGAGALPAQ